MAVVQGPVLEGTSLCGRKFQSKVNFAQRRLIGKTIKSNVRKVLQFLFENCISYGATDSRMRWFISYLSDQAQSCVVEGQTSK